MKTLLTTIALILLSSCTTATVNTSANPIKAAEYNASLGSQYLQAGNLKKARAKLLKALEQHAENPKANFNYAVLMVRVNDISEADKHFRKAIRLLPDESYYVTTHGIFLCQNDRYEEAIAQLLRSATNPYNENPEFAYNNAGSCALKKGKIDAAMKYSLESLRRNTRFAPALINLADIALQQKKTRVAESYYSRFLKYGRQSPDSLWLGIRIKRLSGDSQSVRKYGFQLKRDFPESRETLLYLESNQP